jgi:hypothetical protein
MQSISVRRTDEEDFYGSVIAVSLHEWFPAKPHHWKLNAIGILDDRWVMPTPESDPCLVILDCSAASAAAKVEVATTEQRFLKLADEWSRNTMHVSSASDLINDRSYREIIDLGWDAVPYLLMDLKKNKRFWFPALAEITQIRPFDESDMSNPRRMAEAWIRWGKRKGYKLD